MAPVSRTAFAALVASSLAPSVSAQNVLRMPDRTVAVIRLDEWWIASLGG